MPLNGFIRGFVDCLYGASVLPSLREPQGVENPMKLLRDVRPPFTTSLLLLLLSESPLDAAMSSCVSSWYTKRRISPSFWNPRAPRYDRLVPMAGIQPTCPTGTLPFESFRSEMPLVVTSNETSRL